MIVPRLLVPVDVKLADIASAQEILKDGPTQGVSIFACESKQAGLAILAHADCSRGLLEGSTLRSDGSANKKLYGQNLIAKEIVRVGKVGVPASVRELVTLLDKKSPKNESDPVSLKE